MTTKLLFVLGLILLLIACGDERAERLQAKIKINH